MPSFFLHLSILSHIYLYKYIISIYPSSLSISSSPYLLSGLSAPISPHAVYSHPLLSPLFLFSFYLFLLHSLSLFLFLSPDTLTPLIYPPPTSLSYISLLFPILTPFISLRSHIFFFLHSLSPPPLATNPFIIPNLFLISHSFIHSLSEIDFYYVYIICSNYYYY